MKTRVNPELLQGLEMFPDLDLRPENLQSIREGIAQMRPPTVVDDSLSLTDKVIVGMMIIRYHYEFIVQNQIMNLYLSYYGYMVVVIS